ncbi:hypothetical protein EIP91_010278 [Steccherinum ochraceum]|uniref:Uncharacterized protein n=1 Tax=Steccherinum ochraceum TaxID=92696 RepID=A0A4R0RNH8_9APHY|nr:hypothetical protein EIP91_010278 [Steccherinum ochraceum]
MDRTFYPESDLDLYVPNNSDVQVFEWLLRQGYRFVPHRNQRKDLGEAVKLAKEREEYSFFPRTLGAVHDFYGDEDHGNIEAVYTFTKSSPRAPNNVLKVQCIVACKSAPMQVVLSFHSSCVMNVISYEKAYSLYPRGTLHEHRNLVFRSEHLPGRAKALKKYERRGFKPVRHDPPPSRGEISRSFPYGARYAEDTWCWRIPLDVAGVDTRWRIPGRNTVLPGDPVSATSWVHEPSTSYELGELRFEAVTSKNLHFGYVLDESACNNVLSRAEGRGGISYSPWNRNHDDRRCIDDYFIEESIAGNRENDEFLAIEEEEDYEESEDEEEDEMDQDQDDDV